MIQNLKVKFNNRKDTDFVTELRSRVDEYFKERNLSTYANGAMVFKTIALLAITFVPYIMMYFFVMPIWAMLLMVIIMGVGFAGIGFSIGHDALHSAYSPKPIVNKLLGLSFNLIGANDYIWKIKHNMRHHTYTNIYKKDDDLEAGYLLRFTPDAPWEKPHRYQAVTAYLIYALLSVGWVLYFDLEKLKVYNGNGSLNPDVKHPRNEVIKLYAFKIFYILYMLVLPMILLPVAWWVVLIGFFIMHFVAGLTLSLVFQLAHVIEEVAQPVPEPETGLVDNAWAVHQMQTTANYGTRNKLLTWFVGGLNFQIEHHLFPNICSIHYPAISPIVEETAKKYNVPYFNHEGFLTALASHHRLLKRLSKP
jgi:linoleoyl-CoA desaturase